MRYRKTYLTMWLATITGAKIRTHSRMDLEWKSQENKETKNNTIPRDWHSEHVAWSPRSVIGRKYKQFSHTSHSRTSSWRSGAGRHCSQRPCGKQRQTWRGAHQLQGPRCHSQRRRKAMNLKHFNTKRLALWASYWLGLLVLWLVERSNNVSTLHTQS